MTATPAKILFVDDEPEVLSGMQRQFHGVFEIHTSGSGHEGLLAMEQHGPFAVVVSDMRMPEMDGATFLAKVRTTNPETERILLTGYADINAAIAAVNEGQIFRYLVKPCEKEVLLEALEEGIDRHERYHATRRMLASNKDLQMLAMEDMLLGIGNRRAMEHDIDHMHSTALRYQRDFSLILFDVDFFKDYVKKYGNDKGDQVLVTIVKHIAGSIRGADRLYRVDDVKLLLIMPETDENGAMILAGRLVNEILLRDIAHEGSQFGAVTLSAGVCGYDFNSNTPNSSLGMLYAAENALSNAKVAGRNCAAQLES